MTYRIPYHFAGYRADNDPEFVDAFELRRLAEERAPLPVVDLTDPQADE